MAKAQWDNYIEQILSFVKFKHDHKAIRQELEEHMEDLCEELQAEGMDEDVAEQMAVEYMGEAEEIGVALNKEHGVILGRIWLVTRILAFALIGATISPAWSVVGGTISNRLEKYEPAGTMENIHYIELNREYQVYDDILMLEGVYHYESGRLDVVYRTRRKPFARSIDWSDAIDAKAFDAEGEKVSVGGGGYKQGGNYGLGCDSLEEVPADAKTLEIYFLGLIITVDLETEEVTDNEET